MKKEIIQKVKSGAVAGRNGYFALCEVVVRPGVWRVNESMIFFDCKGKRGNVLNAGFVMDEQSALELFSKLGKVVGK